MQGKLSAAAQNLVTLWDWLRLGKRDIDENFTDMLKQLMAEKAVAVPDVPVVSGGTITHKLPSASDDRAGLSGSISMISTQLAHPPCYKRIPFDALPTLSESTTPEQHFDPLMAASYML